MNDPTPLAGEQVGTPRSEIAEEIRVAAGADVPVRLQEQQRRIGQQEVQAVNTFSNREAALKAMERVPAHVKEIWKGAVDRRWPPR